VDLALFRESLNRGRYIDGRLEPCLGQSELKTTMRQEFFDKDLSSSTSRKMSEDEKELSGASPVLAELEVLVRQEFFDKGLHSRLRERSLKMGKIFLLIALS
jgi:hypothetical protein